MESQRKELGGNADIYGVGRKKKRQGRVEKNFRCVVSEVTKERFSMLILQ